MAENNQTSGPTGVKDLGGLVNKDIAFSKVPENVVFDSKNFRITTDDGGTLAVRSTIKGNEEIPNTQTNQTTCINNGKIIFNYADPYWYFIISTNDTIRTTVEIINSAGVATNVYYDHYLEPDNFITTHPDFYPGAVGYNYEHTIGIQYVNGLLNYLKNNSVVQQAGIVIDTTNYVIYDSNPAVPYLPNTLQYSFTSPCNTTINILSVKNLSSTDSNGLSYLGYFNDPYLENFVLEDATNGLSGADPYSTLYTASQTQGFLANYNQLFDKNYVTTSPFDVYPISFIKQLDIISEYNDLFSVQWDPTLADTASSALSYFLPVEKTNSIVDSTTSTTILTDSKISFLKIQDKFLPYGPRPIYLRNTAIVNNQLDLINYSSNFWPNLYDGTWYFDLSYYIGKMTSNISLTVKIYIHLHHEAQGAQNPLLVDISGVTTTGTTPLVNEFPTIANPTYFPPDTYIGNTYSDFSHFNVGTQNFFGGNNVTVGPYYTDLHTLVYSETFTTGSQNKLEAFNNNVQFSITFPTDLSSLGANVTPSISVFLEPAYIGPPTGTWDYEFYLDKLDVRSTPINDGSQVVNNFQVINNDVTTTTISGTPYPQDLLIGWCTLRDNLYLFFTNGKEDPDDPTTWSNPAAYTPSTKNEIWKFTYNKAGNFKDTTQYPSIFNFQLVYSNPDLNFTIHRPIANPGMIESRYENDAVQKIYWTDNFNVPRQINVADPNVASFTVDQLNLQPILSMDMPLITEVIDGGNLLVGVYQVVYRLKTINGAETRFGRTSQLIPIIDYPETSSDTKYYYPLAAVGTKADKSIAVEVYNLDTDFDTIEFVLIYYDADNTPKTIDIVKEAFIPENGYVRVVINGGEQDPVPITIDELTAFTTSIKRCKTLAAKKQTLFLGNIITGTSIVDWDARAYRFPINSNQTRIKDDQNNSYLLDYNNGACTLSGMVDPANNTTTYANPIPVDVQADCIQNYDMQAPTNDTKYLYKPNSNVLGGAGPNVSYEFVTATMLLDWNNNQGNGIDYGQAGPFLLVANDWANMYSPGNSPTFFFPNKTMSNNASPYRYDAFVGYRRDEMERFGIVFFDELDNPTYVNWIADIRMPHIYMPDTSQGSSIIGNSPPMYPGTGNKRTRIGSNHSWPGAQFTSDIITYSETQDPKYWTLGKPLGIRFTIDFSKVPVGYKKAAIVRVPKGDEDRHIIGQGIARPTYKQDGTGAGDNVFTCAPTVNNLYSASNPTDPNPFNEIWHDSWTISSPEFLFNGFPGFAGSDTVDFVSLLKDAQYSYLRAANDTDQNAGVWVLLDHEVPNNNFFTGIKTKLYQTIEGPLVPSAIKQYTYTANPYPLETAISMGKASGYAGQYSRPYRVGSTIVPAGSGGTARTIYNGSPRDINNPPMGGLGAGWNGGYSYGNRAVFFQIKDAPAYDWNYTVSYGGKNHLGKDGWGINSLGGAEYITQYLANYKRAPAAQFGGNSYFQRAVNEYIPCNNLIDISNKSNPITFDVFGGDTRIAIMDHTTQFFDYAEAANTPSSQTIDLTYQMHFFPVETSIAIDYRRSIDKDRTQLEYRCIPNRFQVMQVLSGFAAVGGTYWTTQRMSNHEHFEVDKVFNHTDKSIYTYFPAPALGTISNKFDCRIWKSEPKVDGEVSESWSIFKPSAYKDVESAYGPINNLIIFRDKMYYFQDRGFGIAQVDEQKLVQAGNNTISDLVLGSSGILERYDYISTKTGTKHQFSMSVSDYSIIWFDSLARKMYRYKGEGLEPLSDIKGLNAYLYNRTAGKLQIYDNPYIFRGIHSTYDFRHNEFYTTFVDESDDTPVHITLVYNDLLDGFIGEYTHYPKVYINDKVNIFSPRPTMIGPELFFIHNYGQYGRFYNRTPDFAELSFVLNTSSITEKVLQNLEFVSEAYAINTIIDPTDSYLYDPLAEIKYQDFFDSMRIFDNYQNTDWINLIPNRVDLSSRDNYARKHKTIWDVRVPSDRVLDVNLNIFDPLNLSPVRPRLTKRLKDKWFMVQLIYNNANNNKLVVHSVKPTYALNSR